MKKIFLIFIIFCFSISLYSQIGGLSASKLNTITAESVAKNQIEFEPAFSITATKGFGYNRFDSPIYNNSFGFRFTYGAFKNTEFGFSVPFDMSNFQFGSKFMFFSKDQISSAFFGGLNIDFSTTIPEYQAGGGVILSTQNSEIFSTDLQIGYIYSFHEYNPNGFYVNMDNGVYIGKIQYILGANFLKNIDLISNYELWLTPGITIEPAKNFLLVLMYPFTVWGDYYYTRRSFNFALTITLF